MTDVRESASTAVAERDSSPRGLIAQYSNDFAMVLPSHVPVETWVRITQGALKKGKRAPDGRYELEVAAANNPGVFLATLLDAARLGLEPGTTQYHLTPRSVKGRLEILGIVGYEGYIELMYRAGAVSSVIAECVYTEDQFTYQPGRDQYPIHIIDWDREDRGRLRLVYAYARMRDGAVSKVVVMNRAAINAVKATSKGSDSTYSPWQTHEASMWLKSAVRQLQKWVPTSAEYRDALRADAVEIQKARAEQPPAYVPTPQGPVDTDTGEIIDGEFVDDETTEPTP